MAGTRNPVVNKHPTGTHSVEGMCGGSAYYSHVFALIPLPPWAEQTSLAPDAVLGHVTWLANRMLANEQAAEAGGVLRLPGWYCVPVFLPSP